MGTLNINLFGQYGSGKGTQRELLMRKYDLGNLETGEIIRQEIRSGSELGKKVEGIIATGDLISDEDIFQIFENFFASYDKDKGIVFDGLPRTLVQKEHFDAGVKKLNREPINIELVISEDTSFKRQMSREGDRSDKSEETSRKRIHVYQEQIKPVIEAYKSEGKMYQVDGEQVIEKVFEDICKIVDEHGNR